jgi:hypothetical protein
MNGSAARFFRLGVSLAGLVILGWVLTGQAAGPAKHRVPLVTDWSHRHMIFSQPRSAEELARVSRDPRYWQQVYRREQPLMLPGSVGDEAAIAFGRRRVKRFHRDWAEDLGTGASAGAGNYPAKYSYDATTANCGSATTPDYVVYSTGLAGSSSQADIVAYDNLYSGCIGTVPSVYWAYNTGGTVFTSPVPSLDGTQVAFVETNGGFGILVLLKWAAATGTVTSPVTPALKTPAQYRTCTAPCMTQILLKDSSGTQTDDTTSSVYYDFTNDIAWVGGALGWLHEITGVFKGTPAEVNNGVFPVQVNATTWISNPVFDRVSNLVFVGDASGFLYSVDATTATVTQSGQLDFGTGLIEGPVVDTLNQFVYVFASSDNSGLCTAGANCSAVYQLSTTFIGGDVGTEATVGDSVVTAPPNPNPLYIGGFDSAYYSSSNATGNLYVCGNTGANPTLFQVPIAAGALPASGNGITSLATSGSPACSPVTDVPNPNTTGGPSERLFVSVQNRGLSSACSAGGCILNFVNAPWTASTSYAVGQQILDSTLRIETVITAGTSGTTQPTWGGSAGGKKPDNTVTWINQGALTASPLPVWLASHHYSSTSSRIADTNGNVQVSTTNPPGALTGASQPVWNTTPGGTTPDNQVVWTNAGPVATFALASTGGTSGIISDNTVAPGTLAGASQVYFTTLADQSCTGGTGGCAVQASQPALQ